MPSDLDKILGKSERCLSNEEMMRYMEGDPEVQRTVERHLVDCELCNTAMEGFIAVPAFAAVPDLNKQIRASASKGAGFSWGGAAGIVGTAAVVAVIFLMTDKVVDEPVAEVRPSTEQMESPLEMQGETEKPAALIEDDMELEDEAIEEPIDETILKETIAEQPEVTTNAEEAERIIRGPGPKKIVIKKTERIQPINGDDSERQRRPKIFSNVHVAFVHDLLVVDYSKILTSGVSTLEEHHGSTHPQFENKQDRTIITFEPRTYTVPYLEFLEDAMMGFARGNPRRTLIELEVLLEQHNGDVNGLFYSGLCYYHMDRPDKAIPYFDEAISSSINTFYEEAKWYKALSLVRTGEKEAANALMEEIVEEGGFYAERAQERLTEFR